MQMCIRDRTLRTLQLRFEKYDLVICDEFGYVSCDKEGGEPLFNHLSLRAGKKATIITTNSVSYTHLKTIDKSLIRVLNELSI